MNSASEICHSKLFDEYWWHLNKGEASREAVLSGKQLVQFADSHICLAMPDIWGRIHAKVFRRKLRKNDPHLQTCFWCERPLHVARREDWGNHIMTADFGRNKMDDKASEQSDLKQSSHFIKTWTRQTMTHIHEKRKIVAICRHALYAWLCMSIHENTLAKS